jgi:hypothetical protein
MVKNRKFNACMIEKGLYPAEKDLFSVETIGGNKGIPHALVYSMVKAQIEENGEKRRFRR